MSQFRTLTPLLRRSTQSLTQKVIRIPRRQLSTIQSLRTAIKSFEHNTGIPLHLPQTARQQGHAASDWGKQIKKATTTSMFWLPAIGLILGWPLIAEGIVDGHL